MAGVLMPLRTHFGCCRDATGLEKPGLLPHNNKFHESYAHQIVFMKCPILPHPALSNVHNNKFNTSHMSFRLAQQYSTSPQVPKPCTAGKTFSLGHLAGPDTVGDM